MLGIGPYPQAPTLVPPRKMDKAPHGAREIVLSLFPAQLATCPSVNCDPRGSKLSWPRMQKNVMSNKDRLCCAACTQAGYHPPCYFFNSSAGISGQVFRVDPWVTHESSRKDVNVIASRTVLQTSSRNLLHQPRQCSFRLGHSAEERSDP